MIINSVSYKINVGIVSSPNPKNESTIYRTFIDGSLSSVNYGARIDRTAEIEVKFLTQTQFYTLSDYLITNSGNKIQILYESPDEQLWLDVDGTLIGDDYQYYVYVLDVNELQEEDFSKDDSLYKIKIKFGLAGTSASSVPNETDTANLNAFIEIDTLGENVTRSASAPSSPVEGDRWLDTTVNVLYERSSLGVWVSLYTVFADDVNYGWVDGKFYLSAFAGDTTTDIYKAGILNYNSIKFPGQSIDISKGPALSRKEGFTFTLKNNDATARSFWNFVIINGINLFGAVCTLKLKYVNDVITYATGRNLTNSFSYENYSFKVEPFLLNNEGKMPDTTIEESNPRYTDVKRGIIGKAPYITYGTHQWASLQDISSEGHNMIVTRKQYLAAANVHTTTAIVGRIEYVNTPTITSSAYSGPNTVYTIASPSTNYDNVVVGDQVSFTGFTKTNNNNISTVVSYSAGTLTVLNPNVNNSASDESPGASTMSFLTPKIYVRRTPDPTLPSSGFKAFDHFEFSSDDISDLNSGELALTVSADSRFATSDANIKQVRQITKVDTSTDPDYYILYLNEFLPVPSDIDPDPSTDEIPPRTRDYIEFEISKSKFKYQTGEDVSQSFGIYNDNGTPENNVDFSFTEDALRLYTFDEQQKKLVPIPATDYTINADKNLISLIPEVAGGSLDITSLKEIVTALPVINNNNGQILGIYTSVYNLNGFLFARLQDMGSLLTLPTGFGFYALASGVYSAFNNIAPALEYVFDATSLSSDGSSTDQRVVNQSIHTQDNINPNDHHFRITINRPGDTSETRTDDACGIAIKLPVNHSNDELFINKTAVKILMKLKLSSTIEWDNTVYTTDPTNIRSVSCGFNVHIRFRRFDGTYEYTASEWKYEFPRNVLGVSHLGEGTLGAGGIDNVPDPNDVTKTAEGRDVLDNKPNIDYEITKAPGTAGVEKDGDLVLDLGLDEVKEWGSGGTVLSTVFDPDGTNDDLKTVNDVLNDTVYITKGTVFEIANPDTDFKRDPRMKGRDLIDLTNGTLNLFNGSGKWEQIEAMELFITPKFSDQPFDLAPYNSSASYQVVFPTWHVHLEFEEPPKLYIDESISLNEKPLFSAVKGKLIDGVFTEDAGEITEDILDIIYPNKYDTSSIADFYASTGSGWKWRRQFTSAMTADATLKELLLNMWACATINEEDKLEFHALDTSKVSSASALALTDSNIIKGSFSKVTYRQAKDIYQFFKLGYDYYIPSEFSSADLQEYSKQETVNENRGEVSIRKLINSTKTLYNLNNFYTENFKYHYTDLPLIESIVKWMAFNSWQFKVDVAIETVITPTPIRLMSPVTLTSYFHSSDAEFQGFVTSIKLNIYNGTATLGIYIPQPAGVLGPLCDPFNDALKITGRDISGWTDGNGQRNDAGRVSTRSVAGLTEKDGNKISTRTFEC